MPIHYEITDPSTGFVHVHASELDTEAEIRAEWLKHVHPSRRDAIEPRRIRVREIPEHELAKLTPHPETGELVELKQRELPLLDRGDGYDSTEYADAIAREELRRQEAEELRQELDRKRRGDPV